MEHIIQIVHLEDDLNDAQLVDAKLAEAGLSFSITPVRTQDEFERVLGGNGTDIILANHRLSMYDGMSALQLANGLRPDIPFIFVSDALGEEAAIEALTRGAVDYVLKQNLSRLAPAVRRALKEARNQNERKQAEKRLYLLTFALDKVREAAFLIDENARLSFVNEGACRTLGYTREELLGLTVSDVDPDFPAKRWLDHWHELKEKSSLNFESRHRTKDGRLFPVEISANYFEYGRESYHLAIVRDITERKEAEKRLKESELRYRSLVENVPDFISRFDTELRFLYVNPSITRAFDLPFELFAGKKPSELPSIGLPDQNEILEKNIREAIDTGNINRIEAELLVREGNRCYEFIHIPEKDEKGTIVSVLAITRDITERIRVEREQASHLDFFINMDRINRAIQSAESHKQMMSDVLDTVLSIFDCDRAYLLYPCDPDSPTWFCPMERNKPEYPGVLELNREMPMEPQVAETLRILIAADGPVAFGPGTLHALPKDVSKQFGFKCFIAMAIHPKIGSPWQFGIHQCSHDRTWTPEEKRLFQEIGRRLADGLTSMLASRDLQESKKFLNSIVENIPDMIFVKDAETLKFVRFNRAGEKLLGYSRDELLGKNDYDLFPKEEADFFTGKDRDALKAKALLDIPEEKILTRSNDERILHTKKIPMLGEAGKPQYLLGISEDITERKRAEEKMLRSDQRLRLHSEQSPLGFLEWDENFHAIDWNAACERIFGYTREEAIGRHAKDLILPIKVQALVDGIFQSLMNQTGGQHSINENVTKDGRSIICEWVNTTLINKEGKAIGVASICADITERKKVEEALALKNRINDIFLTFPGKEMYWEVLQVILELTESPYGIFAYLDEEGSLVVPTLTGEVWEACQIPDKSFVFPRKSWGDSIWGKVIREKRSIYSNISYKVPDGHIPIKKALGIPITYQDEVIGHFLVANRETDYGEQDKELLEGIADLISPMLYSRLQTERQEKLRKRSEAELKHLKNHLANIIDSMPSMLVGIDNDEKITQWNRQVEMSTGIPAAQAIGKPVKQMFPDLSSHIEAMIGEIKQYRTAVMEKLPVEKEEERRLYDLMLYPLITNGTEGAVLRIEDVTEQARIQNMMVQTEKMMSLGGLAAGMAHEINNPLGIITQAAQNLERRIFTNLKANLEAAEETGVDFDGVKAYFEKRQIPEFVGSIREASRRASKIIGNILRFSRSPGSVMQPTSLVSVINQALELAASDYDLKKKYDFKRIEIIRDYAPDIPEVPMVAVEIEQVMLNLFKNGAQAMIENPPNRVPRITLRLRREERYILIEVEDNGPGMTEEVRHRVFEPFFTTKEPGIGTGLGLSVSYMIITQNHKGIMEAASPPGQGACFRVRLPLSKEDTHEKSLHCSGN